MKKGYGAIYVKTLLQTEVYDKSALGGHENGLFKLLLDNGPHTFAKPWWSGTIFLGVDMEQM